MPLPAHGPLPHDRFIILTLRMKTFHVAAFKHHLWLARGVTQLSPERSTEYRWWTSS